MKAGFPDMMRHYREGEHLECKWDLEWAHGEIERRKTRKAKERQLWVYIFRGKREGVGIERGRRPRLRWSVTDRYVLGNRYEADDAVNGGGVSIELGGA